MVALTHVDIDAAPDDVWPLLAGAEGLAAWLAEEVEGEVAPGEELRLRDAEGDRTALVESVDAGRELALWWWRDGEPPSRVVLRLVARDDGGTRVAVTESAPVAGPLLAAFAGAATTHRADCAQGAFRPGAHGAGSSQGAFRPRRADCAQGAFRPLVLA